MTTASRSEETMTPTNDQITAAARALSNDNADVCNVNREDNWNIYGDSFRETAKIALEAALSAVPAPAPIVVTAGAQTCGEDDAALTQDSGEADVWPVPVSIETNYDVGQTVELIFEDDEDAERFTRLYSKHMATRAHFSQPSDVAAEPVANDTLREAHLMEAVELTIDTLARQLDLIAERAPGKFLDKVPVVRSLTAHKQRLERAVAERNASFTASPAASEPKALTMFDSRPHLTAITTPEPSLREIIRYYYLQAFNRGESEKLADEYIALLAASNSPTGEVTND